MENCKKLCFAIAIILGLQHLFPLFAWAEIQLYPGESPYSFTVTDDSYGPGYKLDVTSYDEQNHVLHHDTSTEDPTVPFDIDVSDFSWIPNFDLDDPHPVIFKINTIRDSDNSVVNSVEYTWNMMSTVVGDVLMTPELVSDLLLSVKAADGTTMEKRLGDSGLSYDASGHLLHYSVDTMKSGPFTVSVETGGRPYGTYTVYPDWNNRQIRETTLTSGNLVYTYFDVHVGVLYPYRYNDKATFLNLDISAAGTEVQFSASDDSDAEVPLPFNFTFFNRTYSQIWVSTNGALYFGSYDTYDLDDYPDPEAPPALQVFLQDLYLNSDPFDETRPDVSHVYTSSIDIPGDRLFIIQWDHVYMWGSDNPITFQAVLYEKSGDIRYQYISTSVNDPDYDNGFQAVAGIQDQMSFSSNFVLYSRNQPELTVGKAVCFGFEPRCGEAEPVIVNAYTDAAGTNVYVEFDKSLDVSVPLINPFTLDGISTAVNSIMFDSTDSTHRRVVLQLSSPITYQAQVKVSSRDGAVRDAVTGVPSKAEAEIAVTNLVAQPKYTVSYNGNGNTEGSVLTDGGSYAESVTTTVYSNTGGLARAGYTFAGWNTAADGSETAYAPGDMLTIGSSNVTLYAQWEPVIPASPDSGDESDSTSSPSNPSSSQHPLSPPNPSSSQDPLSLQVNDQVQDQIATGSTSVQAGRTILTATFDAGKLAAQLEKEGNNPTIVLPVEAKIDELDAVLTGDAVKAMENKQAILYIQTPFGNYKLPASEIDIDLLSAQFGASGDLSGVTVHIQIAAGGPDAIQALQAAADRDQFTVMADPVDFKVSADYNGLTIPVDKFKHFVEREIPIPDGVNPEDITTAVVLDQEGSVHSVPTYIVTRDGKSYAVVNSLTNSLYSLIKRFASFTDVKDHWSEDAVNDMSSRMVVYGSGSNSYHPDAAITRAEFAVTVVRALGLNDNGESASFKDVNAADWHAGAVAKAAEYGIVGGYTDGTFRPNQTVTRQEAMVMMTGAMKWAGLRTNVSETETDDSLSSFSDAGEIGEWAKPSVAANIVNGLVDGSAGELKPLRQITRGETAAIIQRMLREAGLIDKSGGNAANYASITKWLLRL